VVSVQSPHVRFIDRSRTYSNRDESVRFASVRRQAGQSQVRKHNVHATNTIFQRQYLVVECLGSYARNVFLLHSENASSNSIRKLATWAKSITPRLCFTPGERAPRYPLYRRLGGPHSRSGHREHVMLLIKKKDFYTTGMKIDQNRKKSFAS
jgi:hypothetical protein